MKKLTTKKKRQIKVWTRAGIQILFFLFLPSAYSGAFSGIKDIFLKMGQGQHLAWTPFIALLVVLLSYTILFGRFFCGYACAFGSLGDWIFALHRAIAKKRKKPMKQMPRYLAKGLSYMKYVVLALIILLCYWGTYSKLHGTSPWEVFSLLHARHFALEGYTIGLVLLILIMIGMFFEERFFCKFLCPMGAVFSLMPVLPFFALHRDRPDCLKNCECCTKSCPANIELPTDGSYAVSGDCFQCGRCIGQCPVDNIHTGLHSDGPLNKRKALEAGQAKLAKETGDKPVKKKHHYRLRGDELWFTLLRAAILAGLFIWLGV